MIAAFIGIRGLPWWSPWRATTQRRLPVCSVFPLSVRRYRFDQDCANARFPDIERIDVQHCLGHAVNIEMRFRGEALT